MLLYIIVPPEVLCVFGDGQGTGEAGRDAGSWRTLRAEVGLVRRLALRLEIHCNAFLDCICLALIDLLLKTVLSSKYQLASCDRERTRPTEYGSGDMSWYDRIGA